MKSHPAVETVIERLKHELTDVQPALTKTKNGSKSFVTGLQIGVLSVPNALKNQSNRVIFRDGTAVIFILCANLALLGFISYVPLRLFFYLASFLVTIEMNEYGFFGGIYIVIFSQCGNRVF